MYHSLLEKQVKKYLPDGISHSDESVGKLLDAVNESYANFDRDKELNEHAFALSEQEYSDINKRLREEVLQRKRSVAKLIDTIRSIEDEARFRELDDQNLEEIVDYLKLEVERRKQVETELINAKELAEKAAMARSEFLSMMSHEIRTPLNAVVGFTHLMLQGKHLPEQKEQLNLLKFSADNLLALVNDILDFNKIESGKISLEQKSISLLKLVNQVKNTSFTKAQDNGNSIRVMVDTQIPNFVVCDPLRLGQVINNLVSNAVKFTYNGLIIIEALLLRQTDTIAQIQFSVKDNGIGIAAENQERIFEHFTQANESTTREYGGTGLGLAICNGLLEVMDSRIELESRPGKGSTFSFILDLPYTNQGDENLHIERLSKSPQELATDLTGVKILLVEDNNVNTLVAATFLEGWNATIDTAANGKLALEKVQDHQYHIVLMDLHMPVMNGYEATEHIIKLKPGLPVVALTASAMLNIRDKAFQVGMIDYITKPFEPNELFEKIYKNKLPMADPI